jgi:hypothetical protein
VSGQLHAHAALPPGKEPPVPLDRRLGEPRAGLEDMEKWKFLAPPVLELRHSVVQLVASRYTDNTIRAHDTIKCTKIISVELALRNDFVW